MHAGMKTKVKIRFRAPLGYVLKSQKGDTVYGEKKRALKSWSGVIIFANLRSRWLICFFPSDLYLLHLVLILHY